jgi:hypothetical protein
VCGGGGPEGRSVRAGAKVCMCVVLHVHVHVHVHVVGGKTAQRHCRSVWRAWPLAAASIARHTFMFLGMCLWPTYLSDSVFVRGMCARA